MQLKAAKLNNDRLNGNKLFMHKFKSFSTTSLRTSLKIHIIYALIFILFVLILIYILSVVSIIFNIINKKETLASINDLNIKSAKIEKDYNLAITNLSKKYANEHGFIDIEMNDFAIRKDTAASLSFLYENKSK